MRRRFLYAGLVALLAFQAAAMPAFAAAVPVNLAADAHGCPDMGEETSDASECPCCPEGVGSMLECAATCTTASAVPTIQTPTVHTEHAAVVNGARQLPSSQSYLPLNPPPIR